MSSQIGISYPPLFFMLILIKILRVKLLQREALSFIVAGSFNTLFCYTIFSVAFYAGLNSILAMTVAALLTIFVGFFVMSYFVFASQPTLRRSLKFFVMQILGYVINISILELILIAGISGYIGGSISLSTTAIFTYFISKYIVFV